MPKATESWLKSETLWILGIVGLICLAYSMATLFKTGQADMGSLTGAIVSLLGAVIRIVKGKDE